MAPAKKAAVITLGLENRSPKRLRKLPQDLEVSLDIDVEGLKKAIAKASGVKDFNRIGLANPETKKLLKDRREKLEDINDIVNAGKITVKDLGPQISWRGVFVVEYLGPILIHLAVIAARPFVFPGGDKPLSKTQYLSFALFMIHFLKREFETLFVHKFSANTMPASNLFKNSAFYWLMSGLLCAVSIYRPGSPAALATADNKLTETIGTGLFAVSELANAAVHMYLSSLRSTGGTERKIPKGYGFGLVTCPNYMYEILAWIGVIIVSRDWSVALFISVGAAQMYVWAKGKEAAYRKEFGDKYKAKKTVLFPFLF